MIKTISLTLVAMGAFAGNSILCRLALKDTALDAASFTAIRLLSGALVLGCIVLIQRRSLWRAGSWLGAAMLFVYAGAFSFAYIELTAAAGALILFAAVQVTMIGVGLARGEHLSRWQWLGVCLACAGLVGLLLPGVSAPPLMAAMLMLLAGVAWGVYSLLGRGVVGATSMTAGNFLRAAVMALLVWPFLAGQFKWHSAGALYAVASGALASGAGYAVWYAVLPSLRAATASTVQLTVPVLTAMLGVLFLQELLSVRLLVACTVVLGGIALVIRPLAHTRS
ncbi:DMT family transporter [Simiduia sp. 21SJ11W-1]|uniref:DMT family transporter n=1 Tax=Simiduia sp. 21SJ11W-1 TaxID=2909669 RepID=UPI0020A17BDB|nr:DMT family transporter [Simiduia sp. 21SJ11W-1]UTA49091.1 DMT family transporter [Simiduia sp. 21SJ11W-1]